MKLNEPLSGNQRFCHSAKDTKLYTDLLQLKIGTSDKTGLESTLIMFSRYPTVNEESKKQRKKLRRNEENKQKEQRNKTNRQILYINQ